MKVLAAVLALAVMSQEPDPKDAEAAARLKALGERIAKAGSIHARITARRKVEIREGEAAPRTNTVDLRSEFVFEGAEKSRIRVRIAPKDGTPDVFEVILGGGKLWTTFQAPDATTPRTWTEGVAPEGWRARLLGAVTTGRPGSTLRPTIAPNAGEPPFESISFAAPPAATKIAAAGTERVGQRDCTVIRYEWNDRLGGKEVPVVSTLWLDAKTGLPAKRLHRFSVETEKRRLDIVEEERFEAFSLDEPVDSKEFEVPPGK